MTRSETTKFQFRLYNTFKIALTVTSKKAMVGKIQSNTICEMGMKCCLDTGQNYCFLSMQKSDETYLIKFSIADAGHHSDILGPNIINERPSRGGGGGGGEGENSPTDRKGNGSINKSNSKSTDEDDYY